MNPDTYRPPALAHPLRLLAVASLALIALALAAGSASAAGPIDLGPADEAPSLALDANGAAHLSWVAPGVGNSPLHYCRIDRGGSGCASAHTFPQVGTFTSDFGNAPLLVAGGAVDVLDARFNGIEQKQLWTSANSFASPTVVGSNQVTNGKMAFTQALYAPKGTVSGTADVVATILGGPESGGASFQASGLTGTTEGSAVLSPSSTADATIGRYGPSLIAVYIGLDSGRPISWRRYTGSGTPASLDNAANWTAAAPIGAGDDEVALAEGIDGLYLAYQGPSDELLLSHYNGISGWEAPVTVTASHATQISAFQDPAGIVHLAWLESETGALHYSYAHDKSNTSFSLPQTLEVGEARETSVATDITGNGWVTWRENSGDAIAMPVEPGEPAPPAPPGGGGGAGGGNAQSPPPAAKTAPPAAPATKSTTAPVVPGLNATLSTPKACVAGGATFTAKVAVKRKGTEAHKLSYSVKQVRFSVGGKLVSTDTTKPFEATLRGSARAGTSIPVAAKISVALKKGHRKSTVTKTLTAKVTTCG